jgi:hypothetical protein
VRLYPRYAQCFHNLQCVILILAMPKRVTTRRPRRADDRHVHTLCALSRCLKNPSSVVTTGPSFHRDHRRQQPC